MPKLSELSVSVFSDLSDTGKDTFTQGQVEDFIRGGIADLNRVCPVDSLEKIAFNDTDDTYPTIIVQPWQVEMWTADGVSRSEFPMVEQGYPSVVGYHHRATPSGGVIEVTTNLINALVEQYPEPSARPIMVIRGYAYRPIPYTTSVLSDPDDPNSPMVPVDPDCGLSHEEEYVVRQYAKSQGFDLLSHDRALFAQWQGQSNNTDVSPVMMMNMAAMAHSDWDRRRNQIRVLRRYF